MNPDSQPRKHSKNPWSRQERNDLDIIDSGEGVDPDGIMYIREDEKITFQTSSSIDCITNEMQEQSPLIINRSDHSDQYSSASTNSITTMVSERVSKDDIMYAIEAYTATAKPVAVTMILSSLSVIFIKSDILGNNQGLNVYEIDDDDSTSNSVKFQESLINAGVMVLVICSLTFLIVLLFYLKCNLLIKGYIMFSSTILLAFLGGFYFLSIVSMMNIPMDIFFFLFFLYNFSVTGIKAIFFSEGIPQIVTQVKTLNSMQNKDNHFVMQAYLVFASVLLAWNLSRFDNWTTWSLLGVLALYDIFAVLAPCGPLKALLKLMKARPNQDIPGLLYEANLEDNINLDYSQHVTNGIESRHERRSDTGFNQDTVITHETIFNEYLHVNDGLEMTNLNPRVVLLKPSTRSDVTYQSNNPTSNSNILAASQNMPSPSVSNEHSSKYSKRNSVKLGLGDFVFYSVLVSRAAVYGFRPFIVCFFVILGVRLFTKSAS